MPRSASAAEGPAASGWNFTIGGAAMLAPKFEGSRKYGVKPLPVVEVGYSDWFRASFASGARVDALALGDFGDTAFGRLSAGPLVRYGHGRSSSDDDALRGFRTVKGAIEAGGFLGLQRGPWNADLAIAQAVNSGSHEGLLADFSLGYRFGIATDLTGRLGTKVGWASERYMQSMFGIDAATARASQLPGFTASSGFKDAGVSLGVQYSLGRGLWLDAMTGYTRLLGDAASSPLVKQRGSPNQAMTAAGLSFRF
jgi:outer membrane protein